MSFVEEIKSFFANFPKYASQPFEVKDEDQYMEANKWIKHVNKLLRKQLIIQLLIALIISIISFGFLPIHPILKLMICLFYILVFAWSAVGTATLKLYKKELFNIKSMIAWGKAGYDMGEQIKTTHVTVNHEYGNTYRVSSYTEDKGCLFAVIALFIRYMIFAPYCLFKGLPLTLNKYRKTMENMQAYRSGKTV